MISQAKHRRNYNKIHNAKNRATMKPTSGNQVSIFPFEIILGAINVTNTGNIADNTIISDYVHYEKVFTGLENVVARWEGAYNVELVNDDDLFLTKTVQVGRSIKAIYQNKEASTDFENSPVSDDFANMITNERYTLNIYEEFSLADQFKLYIIPELSAEKWLRVVSARFPKQGVKGGHVELVLETVNNDIATSGRAVQQFIQTGGAGEGHAWPVVVNSDTIILDENRIKDVPTTTMQLEVAGSYPLTTLYAYGRPVVRDPNGGTMFNPIIEAPRLLLPLRIETPTPSAQNTRPTAVSDYHVANLQATQWSQHKEWKERLVGDDYFEARRNDEGLLISEKNKSVVIATNPVSGGTRQYLLWDEAWVFNVEKIYNTSPDPYTGNQLKLTGDYTAVKLLAHNFFGTSPIEALPKEITSNISFGFRDIPLVGGFLNYLTGGINPKFNNQAYRFGTGAIPMIIPADTIEYGNVLMGRGADETGQIVFMPMDIFSGKGTGVETEANTDIQSQGTIFRVQLTDRFIKTIGGVDYVFNTKDLGQQHPTIDDNGTLVIGITTTNLQWDDTCEPTDRGTTQGYVIDLFGHKGIGKYDYRMSFYSNDFPVFQATYQTQARFTGSNRDWNNTVKLTKWEESSNKHVSYPQTIVQPDPPDTNNPPINITEWLETPDELTLNYRTAYSGSCSPTGINTYLCNYSTSANIIRTAPTYQFDTTDLGGITNFKNNYETIDIDTTDGTHVVNIDDLISAGEIYIKTSPTSTSAQTQVPYTGYISGDATATSTATINNARLTVNGNIIELFFEDNETIGTGSRVTYTASTSGDPTIVFSNRTATTSQPWRINGAVAQPKGTSVNTQTISTFV